MYPILNLLLACTHRAALPASPPVHVQPDAVALQPLTTVRGLQHPESVLHHGRRHFISNIGVGLEPLAHDGDGFIVELDDAGRRLQDRAPLGPLDAPKGMAVLDGVLYVADIDRLVGFGLSDGARVYEAALPEPVLLNDLIVTPAGELLASETLGGCVYRVRPPATELEQGMCGLPGANGLGYDARGTLFVAGIGASFEGDTLYQVDFDAGTARSIPAVHGLLDGVATDTTGALVVSDWQVLDGSSPARLWRWDGVEASELQLPVPIDAAADLAFDPQDRLWIPSTLRGEVVILAPPTGVPIHQIGTVGTFSEGAYDGTRPLEQVLALGDLGTGAGDHLEGELIVVDGRAWIASGDGETREVGLDEKIPFATLAPWRPSISVQTGPLDWEHLVETLERLVAPEVPIAVRIRGEGTVRGRVPSPVERPYPPIDAVVAAQRTHERTGTFDLVGVRMPDGLGALAFPGLHLHYLTADRTAGGHVLEARLEEATIEISVGTRLSFHPASR